MRTKKFVVELVDGNKETLEFRTKLSWGLINTIMDEITPNYMDISNGDMSKVKIAQWARRIGGFAIISPDAYSGKFDEFLNKVGPEDAQPILEWIARNYDYGKCVRLLFSSFRAPPEKEDGDSQNETQ